MPWRVLPADLEHSWFLAEGNFGGRQQRHDAEFQNSVTERMVVRVTLAFCDLVSLSSFDVFASPLERAQGI